MKDLSLPALQAFASVAGHGGFRRAASELGMSPSALSHAVATVEERLGTRLLNRTTRSVTVTDAGRQLLARLGPALQELHEALAQAADSRTELRGTVRLNASRLAVATVLGPRLPAFLAHYPQTEVEVTVDDDGRDIVGRGFDATVRLSLWMEKDMVGQPVGPRPLVAMAASPAYLAEHPAPQSPNDLADHACLCLRLGPGAPLEWRFKGHPSIKPHGQLMSNDLDLLVSAALGGAGIIYEAEPLMREHFQEKRLLPVLEQCWPRLSAVSIFYPSRRQIPPPLQALIAFLRDS